MQKITYKQFIRLFTDTHSLRFCFILGAGASKSSGIPTGAELAKTWIKEIEEDMGEESFNSWLKEESIDRDDYARYYPRIFAKRFEAHHQASYDYLERTMQDAEPSCGYSFLAQILEGGQHNLVITTNFDNLTEDALFIYTSKKPLVIGHSSLADFISVQSKRPQVIKVHHDLFLSPKNSSEETEEISEKFKGKLTEIFKDYTPVVIGYGGNDGGFMNVLDESLHGIFYWCYREGDPRSAEINKLVKEKDGVLVLIDGFDELMVSLGNVMRFGLLDKQMEEVASQRTRKYREQIEEVNKRIENPVTKKELLNVADRGADTWWKYELRAQQESDVIRKENVYKNGLKVFPESHDLMNNYAIFLSYIKEYKKAEEYYKKALSLQPNDADFNGNYALLLLGKRQFDQAKIFINKAFVHLQLPAHRGLKLELWFYRYACFHEDYPGSKEQVERLLQEGACSPGWPLDDLLEVVKKDGKHPEYENVVRFAKKISGK